MKWEDLKCDSIIIIIIKGKESHECNVLSENLLF